MQKQATVAYSPECACRACRVTGEQASILQLVARKRRREEQEDRRTAEVRAWPSRHPLADTPYWDDLDIDLFAKSIARSL